MVDGVVGCVWESGVCVVCVGGSKCVGYVGVMGV